MKMMEQLNETGFLSTYNIENELELLKQLDKYKPSTKIMRSRKGKKAIKGLKMIEDSHNHSWYKEIKNIADANPELLALFYRGTKISFKEMMEKADEVAKSMKECGIEKGDEIPACLANTPELVYVLLAANRIGAKVNLFGPSFNKEYISQILDGCTNKMFIASDDFYNQIENVLKTKKYNNKVVVSLADSLPEHPELCDEYEKDLDEYYHYENKVNEFKQRDNTLLSFSEFLDYGSSYINEIEDNNNLDTEFLVTYTSGSTAIGFPKALVHTNRSLIVAGKFHDPELSGNPEIKGLRGLAHIHSESNTDVITCISDNLMQKWSVALEPEYDQNKLLDYTMINKPNYLNATTSFIIRMAKQYLIEKKFHTDGNGRKLPFLLACFAVGEGASKGEEKFINKFLKESSAGSGIKIKGLSLPYTTLCVGGGDCEHGGIYYSLWKALYEKFNSFYLKKREFGMLTVPYAQVTALKQNSDGTYSECSYNEYGLIVANSATTMKGYKNNPEKTKELLVRDDLGRDWVSSNIYGYVDEIGGVHAKGRYNKVIHFENEVTIPPYVFEEIITKDTKNILSCSVTDTYVDDKYYPIINIEFQPGKNINPIKVVNSIISRCNKSLDSNIVQQLHFRFLDYNNSFSLTGSGKRNIVSLENMKLENVYEYDINSNSLLPIQIESTKSKQL